VKFIITLIALVFSTCVFAEEAQTVTIEGMDGTTPKPKPPTITRQLPPQGPSQTSANMGPNLNQQGNQSIPNLPPLNQNNANTNQSNSPMTQGTFNPSTQTNQINTLNQQNQGQMNSTQMNPTINNPNQINSGSSVTGAPPTNTNPIMDNQRSSPNVPASQFPQTTNTISY
jgi:hypothetical protein